MLDPQECFRNALPCARACVPQGTPPDPLERSVKTALFLEFWRLLGQKPAQNQRPGILVTVSQRSSFFAVLSSFLTPTPQKRRFLGFSSCERHVFYCVLWVEISLKMPFGLLKGRILRGLRSLSRGLGLMIKKPVFYGESMAFAGRRTSIFAL